MRDSDDTPDVKSPELATVLRELDAQQSVQGMPIGARNRVALALREHGGRQRSAWHRWLPAASFAAGAALVLAVVGARWLQPEPSALVSSGVSVALAPTPTVGAFRVGGEGCVASGNAEDTTLAPHCRLEAEHMTVEVWEQASVRAQGQSVTVNRGRVLFDVEPVRDLSKPVAVGVSHGRIEVVGTRFAVQQSATGGHVDLLEGKIRFHQPDGVVVDVLPGERHAWGDEAVAPFDAEVEILETDAPHVEPESDPKSARSRSRRRSVSAAAAARIIERVTELRAEKRYGAAISELRRALRRPWDARTAQVLSYELGELLRTAEDTEGACQHFEAHQAAYPRGRYRGAVDRVMRRLHCD
ncbi:MAG: FecR domain-containing protein [Myxococcota bacterium]